MNEALADDTTLRKVVQYIVKSGRFPSKRLVLRNLQFSIAVPSHFFPSAATSILQEFSGKDVYDPFAGWGGRTLGSFCAGVRTITATDLQKNSILGCEVVARDFHKFLGTVGKFENCGFSEFMNSTDTKFDVIFTSPPFVGTEDYGSGVQSIREWAQSILVPLAYGCLRILRPGGSVIVHGQDRKEVPVLTMLLSTLTTAGFKLISERKYGKKPGQSVLAFRSM